ncbi:MAG TPA: type II toxin-antitoxin system VapB family antitoxin, partial [Magnetospirillaceae bacterium]|nr:type II toxin-antitoxin system VapB family antitoxin [Magnetospirillaceae bacterium]
MEDLMSLNIKDAEVHKLAQAISRATGESMTSVV